MRALAGFYYSEAAVLHHLSSVLMLVSLSDLLASMEYKTMAPGVEHTPLAGNINLRCRPMRANVIKIDPALRKLTYADVGDEEVRACYAKLRLRMQSLTGKRSLRLSQSQDRLKHPDCYAVSGGFFLFSEAPIMHPSQRTDPVGLLVTDGVVVTPPLFNRRSLVDRACVIMIKKINSICWTFSTSTHTRTVIHHNPASLPPTNSTTAYNRAFSLTTQNTWCCLSSIPR